MSTLVIALVMLGGCVGYRKAARPQATDLRPLDAIFRHLDDVVLHGTQAANVIAIASDSQDHLYALDNVAKVVKVFDQKGGLLRVIGAPGPNPGQFTTPYSLAIGPADDVYVLDAKRSRVNIFNAGGDFTRSFTCSAYGLFPINLSVDTSGNIYLISFRGISTFPRRLLLHKFAADGNYLLSFFPVDPEVERLNLLPVAGGRIAIARNGNLFAAQRVNPLISEFSPTGNLLRQMGSRPHFYTPPVDIPKHSNSDKIQRTLDEWSQLDDLKLVADRFLVVIYRIHSPREYALQMYDLNGMLIEDNIGSDMSVACITSHGNVIAFASFGTQAHGTEELRLARFELERKGAE